MQPQWPTGSLTQRPQQQQQLTWPPTQAQTWSPYQSYPQQPQQYAPIPQTTPPPPPMTKPPDPPQTAAVEDLETRKIGTSSTIKVIVGMLLPIILGGVGVYLMIAGKVTDDIAALFYAGAALIGIAAVLIIIACLWFSRHPPPSDSCLNAFFCMSASAQCCGVVSEIASDV